MAILKQQTANTANLLGGHEVALRALEIAWAGDHKIMLVGPRAAGKRTLAKCFPFMRVAQLEYCYCGNRGSVVRECRCNARMLRRAEWAFDCNVQHYDIVVEVVPLSAKYIMGTRRGAEADVHLHARVQAAKAFQAELLKQHPVVTALTSPMRFDEAGNRIMEMVIRRMSLSVGQAESIRRVSRTIASMAGSVKIEARHVAEAAQYQTLRYPNG